MKKIIRSLFVLTVVAGLATLATRAYFSDTETSTGNRFEAGAIDLTVDSEGHYNGYECIDNLWQQCTQVPGNLNIVVNGSFETPEVTNAASWQIFNSIPGWTIEWESTDTDHNGQDRPDPALQEYHEGVNGWTAYDGDQYAELDTDWDGPSGSLTGEPALVKITQEIATEVGKTYQLSWAFSARPGTGTSNNELKVRIDGVETSYQRNGTGQGNNVWEVYTREFVATDTTTEIQFAGGGTADSLGVFLDDVRVVEMVRECTPSEEFTQQCHSYWTLTDLGPENRFFDFADLKPGDYGENTISLHIENNDAHACMYFDNYSDDDLGLTEPESKDPDEDQEVGVGNGELGENIWFYAWYDDGDNIFEEGEESITLAPVLAEDFLPGNSEYLGVLSASTTSYIGLSWCFGEMTVSGNTISCDGSTEDQNEAQTDAILADVGFYVEQARNNPDFECPIPGQVKPEVDES